MPLLKQRTAQPNMKATGTVPAVSPSAPRGSTARPDPRIKTHPQQHHGDNQAFRRLFSSRTRRFLLDSEARRRSVSFSTWEKSYRSTENFFPAGLQRIRHVPAPARVDFDMNQRPSRFFPMIQRLPGSSRRNTPAQAFPGRTARIRHVPAPSRVGFDMNQRPSGFFTTIQRLPGSSRRNSSCSSFP